jgi:hypothetical protein
MRIGDSGMSEPVGFGHSYPEPTKRKGPSLKGYTDSIHVFIASEKHRKRIPSSCSDSKVVFKGKTLQMEPVECWRCGSIEMLDVEGVDESDIRRYECADCSVCDTCRYYDGYKCSDWPICNYGF